MSQSTIFQSCRDGATASQVPSQQFFSHVGMEPPFPCYYQNLWGVKGLAQGHNMTEVGFETPVHQVRRYSFYYVMCLNTHFLAYL